MKGQLVVGSKLGEPVSGVGSLEVCVDERHRFLLVAWHEVTVKIESRLDRRVAEVAGDCLGIDAGRDEQACECVPALVEANRLEPDASPCGQGSLTYRRWRKRLCRTRAEDKAAIAP